ncbi:MAG: chemotaxis protein CheD [Balneolaceae bacterium]
MNIIVGVGDLEVSAQPEDTLITYALGSCLGIALYDPELSAGGLLHVMMPLSKSSPEKAKSRPAMFVDTGFELLLRRMVELGASREYLQITVAGGASMKQAGNEDYFKIGQRNITTLRKLLWKNGFIITNQDIGGTRSRTMALNLKNGLVTINKKPINTTHDRHEEPSGPDAGRYQSNR